MASGNATDKQTLRERLRARRDALPAAARAAWSEHMAAWAEAVLRGSTARAAGAEPLPLAAAPIVGVYWPLRSEADPRPLARACAWRGASLALPVVVGPDLLFRAWSGHAELEPAGFGALAPGPTAAAVQPDLVVVPLLGFDARGHRLGWGKGFYDRYLAARGDAVRAVGLAFACQQVPKIPTEAHDRRLHGVLTERGWQPC
ncbi:MAG: 5-formyltetrahydrofolate cyclo-ligase [Planctomycetes bacterium]|nr:5-formyltetrahydrofolate cyclo-ligase [Planctomycetota bacterium]